MGFWHAYGTTSTLGASGISCEYLETGLHASHDVWWKTLLLVASNLLMLPTVFYLQLLIKRQEKYRDIPELRLLSITTTIAMLLSVFYHLCQSASVCLLGNFCSAHLIDHIFAMYVPAVSILTLVSRYDVSWTISVGHLTLVFTILLELAFPFSVFPMILVVVMGLCLLVGNLILVRGGRVDDFARYDRVSLLLAAFFAVGGIVCFFMDTGGMALYFLLHMIWHVAIAIAQAFFVAGTNRDLPGWISYHAYLAGLFRRGGAELVSFREQ